MRNKIGFLSIAAVFVMLVVGGIFYIGSQPAESRQPVDVSFTGVDLEPGTYSFNDFTPGEHIVVAQTQCGSETCTENQCCCLNIDTGAQCCRPKLDDNCIASCKKSKPC